MNILDTTFTLGFGAVLGTTGYLIRKVIDNDVVLKTHVTENVALFKSIRDHTMEREQLADERHQDLKDRLVRIETKLDRANGGSHA